MIQSHKFKVGQSVDLVGSQHPASSSPGKFEIVRLMPTAHGHYQYRVRSLRDGHERMVTEIELEGRIAVTQSERYRVKAQTLRDDGAKISDTRIRDEMLIIASQYEQLAQHTEWSERSR